MGAVAETWRAAVIRLGGDRRVSARGGLDLQKRYIQGRRGYHNMRHIEAVLGDITLLAPDAGVSDPDLALTQLAACAHDVVYNGIPGLDERASARWARWHLGAAGLAPDHIERVADLILMTITHQCPPDDLAAALLLDADLAILASDEAGYLAYVAAVRGEYNHLDDAEWTAGRSAVLVDLLARDPLFLLPSAVRHWDASAKRNMEDELFSLRDI
jgi:predicted metal-dependent HD superfamily phosphohydrolase